MVTTPLDAPTLRDLGRTPGGDHQTVVDWQGGPHLLRRGPTVSQDLRLLVDLGDDDVVVLPVAWGQDPAGTPWVARRWIEGQALSDASRTANDEEFTSWIDLLLGGLDRLHRAGWVHGDISPANVIVSMDGSAHLIDLEFAAPHGTRTPRGTPGYLAPELLFGRPPSPATDIFAVGALIGHVRAGGDAAAMAAHFPARTFWDASHANLAALPPDLAALARRCVQRRPSARPTSAAEARRLLPCADRPLPSLDFPFLAGRRDWLEAWQHGFEAKPGVHGVVVQNDDELSPLAQALDATLIGAGRNALVASPEELFATNNSESTRQTVLLVIRAESDVPTAVNAVRALSTQHGQHAVLVSEAVLATISARAPQLLAHTSDVPLVHQDAITSHITSLVGHSLSDVGDLTDDTIERTHGSWSDIAHLFTRAESLGVLARGHESWELQLDAWPDETGETPSEFVFTDARAQQVAWVIALLGRVPSLETLSKLFDADAEDLVAPLGEVLRAASRDDAPTFTGYRFNELLDESVRHSLGSACGAWLAEHDTEARADAVFASTSTTSTNVTATDLLVRANRARLAGRLGDCRRVATAIARRWSDDVIQDRARALVARLDLAQGSAHHVLADLDASDGPLDRAPTPIRTVAMLAAQQAGDGLRAAGLATSLVASDDVDAQAWGRFGVAYAAFLTGDLRASLDALDLVEEGSHECLTASANLRGVVLLRSGGDTLRARAALESARESARQHGDLAGRARASLNLADLHRRTGDLDAEHEELLTASSGFAQAGHIAAHAAALNNLGVLQRDLGDVEQARALLGDALALRRRAFDASGQVVTTISLALATLDAGLVGAARTLAESARSDAERRKHGGHTRFIASRLAITYALAGQLDKARTQLDDSDETSSAGALARALLARTNGDAHEAQSRGREALEAAKLEGRRAEGMRAAGFVLAISPGDENAQSFLDTCGSTSETHLAEVSWRLRGSQTDLDDLIDWQHQFERAGRLDLTRAVLLEVADRHHAEGRTRERRVALAGASECAEAIVDGVDEAHHATLLDTLLWLAGGALKSPQAGDLDLAWFVACNRRMANADDLEGMLLSIVDMSLAATGAQRGLLVLLDENDEIAVHAARGLDGTETAQHLSKSVVLEALRRGETLITTDAMTDDRFTSSTSIPEFHLRSVLCAPLPTGDGVRGALYVDDAETAGLFDDNDRRVVAALADQAALAVSQLERRAEVAELTDSLSRRVVEQDEELTRSRRLLRRRGRRAPVAGIVGESDAIQQVFHLIERLGPTDLPVLVTGPSGSGKDLVARALHARSQRSQGALLIENIAAMPATLLESEFFGHARGAFTGADRARPGLFKEADGGTFVLDEIGEMPVELQAKLLRVLESGEFRPLGSRRTETTDARIVACTHRDLRELVADGAFREDLFYRLNVAEIRLPSLGERLDDIPLLVDHAVSQLNAKHGTTKAIRRAVTDALAARPWPGQVRELFNEVARLYYLCADEIDDASWIRAAHEPLGAEPHSFALADVERATIERALAHTQGNKERAATLLGISRAGLYAKLKRYADGQ